MDQQNIEQPIFNIEKIYVKDLSIEVPNAPQIFLDPATPDINVELSTSTSALDTGFFEAVLRVTVTAKLPEDRTVFLVEVAQAAIFQIRNIKVVILVQGQTEWFGGPFRKLRRLVFRGGSFRMQATGNKERKENQEQEKKESSLEGHATNYKPVLC